MNQHSRAVSSGGHRWALAVIGSMCLLAVGAAAAGADHVRRVRQLGADEPANGIQANSADEPTTASNTASDWASSGRSNQRQPVDIANSAASSAAAAGASSFVDNLMGHHQQQTGSGAAAESVAVSSSSAGGQSLWPFGGGHQQQQVQVQQAPQQHGGFSFGNFGGFGQQQQQPQQVQPQHGAEGAGPHQQHKGFSMNDMNKYLANPMELVNAISRQFNIPREKIVEQLGGRFSFNMDTMLNPMVATIKVIEKTFVPDACRLRFFCQVGQRFSPHLRQHLGRISPQTLGGSAHVKALSQGISGSDCNLAFETCEPKLKKQFEVMQEGGQHGGHQGMHQAGGHEGGYDDQSSAGSLGGGAPSAGSNY